MDEVGLAILLVLCRNPELGRVKSRLASSIGEQAALEAYELLLARTCEAACSLRVDKAIFYSRFIPESDRFIEAGFRAHLQEGCDLGERMHNAFTTAAAAASNAMVLIGTDCPGLTGGILDEAFRLLESNEAVLGPAMDGGYYLVGLRHPMPELFLNRRWSTPTVLQEALATLRSHNIEPALLKELGDVDTLEDLKREGLWPLQQTNR